MRRPWRVTIGIVSEHTYIVDAQSAEDSVAQAEQLLEDGEEGDEVMLDMYNVDAVPVDEESMGNYQQESEEDGEV